MTQRPGRSVFAVVREAHGTSRVVERIMASVMNMVTSVLTRPDRVRCLDLATGKVNVFWWLVFLSFFVKSNVAMHNLNTYGFAFILVGNYQFFSHDFSDSM